jgi:anaerobic ribonucleoside-triphosphate reductase activating protein
MSIADILAQKSNSPVDTEESEFWNWLKEESGISVAEANVKVRLTAINYQSTTCGPGEIRTEVFFQGCNHKCKGCFSPETWDLNAGLDTTVLDLLIMLRPSYGNMSRHFSPLISFCGGEPFLQPKALAITLKYINKWAKHNRAIDRTHTLVYTGYKFCNLIDMSILNRDIKSILEEVDVVIAEPFIEELKEELTKENRSFIGSRNQEYIILDDTGDVISFIFGAAANRTVNLDPTWLITSEKRIKNNLNEIESILKELTFL